MRVTLFARVNPALNPYILLYRRALVRQGIVARLEREFGLTPGARASLQVDPKETNGDIESRYFG